MLFLDQLIGSGSADQQLLELKKKMGMLPSGEGKDAKQLSAGDNEGIDEGEIVEEEGAS